MRVVSPQHTRNDQLQVPALRCQDLALRQGGQAEGKRNQTKVNSAHVALQALRAELASARCSMATLERRALIQADAAGVAQAAQVELQVGL